MSFYMVKSSDIRPEHKLMFIYSGCNLIQNVSSKKFIFQTNVNSRICCLSVNVHTYQLYILTQHSELFKYWSAITRIYIEGKSLILNLGLGLNFTINYLPSVLILIIADHILNDLLCCFDKYNLC